MKITGRNFISKPEKTIQGNHHVLNLVINEIVNDIVCKSVILFFTLLTFKLRNIFEKYGPYGIPARTGDSKIKAYLPILGSAFLKTERINPYLLE